MVARDEPAPDRYEHMSFTSRRTRCWTAGSSPTCSTRSGTRAWAA